MLTLALVLISFEDFFGVCDQSRARILKIVFV